MKKSKRKVMLIISILVMMTLTTGCLNADDYKTYIASAQKTDAITKGGKTISVDVVQTLNEEVAANEAFKWAKDLEHIQFDLTGKFDQQSEQSLYDIYYYYGELGMDMKYLKLSHDENYIKMPMFPEYLKLGSVENQITNEDEVISEKMAPLMKEISSNWYQMLKEKNIFVGEKITIKNEDGSVKATQYTVKPTTEQLNQIKAVIKTQLIENKDVVAEIINAYSKEANMNGALVEKLVFGVMDHMNFEKFEQVSYVDVDGYIIKEHITIGLTYTSSPDFTNLFKAQTITIKTSNWNIEQPVKFDFPVITEENSKPIETYEFNIGQ